jgi:hypothetical protein
MPGLFAMLQLRESSPSAPHQKRYKEPFARRQRREEKASDKPAKKWGSGLGCHWSGLLLRDGQGVVGIRNPGAKVKILGRSALLKRLLGKRSV